MSVSQRMKLNQDEISRAIRDQAAILGRQADAVRRGEPGGVHDMRVASRRLRAMLSEIRPMVAGDALVPFERSVRAVTGSLGVARELDVMTAMLGAYGKNVDGPWRLAADDAGRQIGVLRGKASQECREAVKIVACDEFRYAFSAALAAVDEGDADTLEDAPEKLRARYKKLRKRYLEWNAHPDGEDLHRVRVAQKKLRYACEFYAPLFGADFTKTLKKLTALHEVLGVWHDCHVMCEALVGLEKSADYRAAQGYPLMREAFEKEGRARQRAWQDLARDYFGKKGRDKFKAAIEVH